ncbi:MAG: hypothetical protein ACOC33_03220 [bacterium]
MKNFKITKQILKSNKKNVISFSDLVPSIIASVFSIIFSLSIIVEIANFVNSTVLTFLSIFIVLFLIHNEKTKVLELRKYFSNKKSNNTKRFILIAFTFFMSFSLSGIGIYFWTNKTTELTDNNNINNKTEIANINQKYNSQIDSVNNLSIKNDVNYLNALENLEFWKTRKAATLDERTYIRKQIENRQIEVNNILTEFNDKKENKIKLIEQNKQNNIELINASFVQSSNNINKNNILSYIFFTLVIITEFIIIILSKEIAVKQIKQDELINANIAKEFKLFHNILYSVYTTKRIKRIKTEDGKTKLLFPYLSINDIKYNPITTNTNTDWNEVKKLFNILITLKIISPKGYIQMDETKGLKKMEDYYNRIIQNF